MPWCDFSSDEGDRAKFHTARMVTARNEYRCCECGNPIKKGEIYEYVFGVWGDTEVVAPGRKQFVSQQNTYRTCRKCVNIREHFFPGGWTYGQMGEDMSDIRAYAEEDDDENYDGPEPLRGLDYIRSIWIMPEEKTTVLLVELVDELTQRLAVYES